jgi:hypothetical protein
MKRYPTFTILILAACVLTSFSLAAQPTGQITGLILDEKNTPIELATVLLKSTADTLIHAAAYTEADGSYRFEALPPGNYFVEAGFVGYTRQQGPPVTVGAAPFSYPQLQLQPDAALLEQVTVTARTQFVERLADRTVINPEALITNAGANALEALEKAPGVQVYDGGDIRLKGRSGVAIFIDDKPTYLSGAELESYLRSIPSSSIKQIELMPNPPAKYEAAGNAGVINIITKRNKAPGFNGNASLAYTQGRYSRSNNSLNINLNRRKVGLFLNLSAGHRNFFQDLNIYRAYTRTDGDPSSSFAQNSFIRPKSQSWNTRLGFDFYLNEKTTLGLVVRGLANPSSNQTDNVAFVTRPDGALLNVVLADNAQDASFQNTTYNLNLRRNLGNQGSAIIMDADYVAYRSNADQFFQNFVFDWNGNLSYADTINGSLPSDISILAAKVDYSRPFQNGLKMEAGLKSAFTQTDNEAAYTTTKVGVTFTNYDLSNRFLYDEWIHAAYINFSKTLGPIDFQAGLRVEHTRLEGAQLGNEIKPGSRFTRNYTEPFPTFFVNWRMDSLDQNTLSLSYGRRIDRPFFQDLNPFISPLDRFTFYTGNPNLLPTFSHNLSLTHSFKGRINTTLNYSKTLDGINETLEIINEIYYSRPGNISTNESISLSIDATLPVGKWLTIIAYAEGGHLSYKSPIYNQQLDAGSYYGFFSLAETFKWGQGWSGELRANYNTNVLYAQLFIKSFGTLNLAVAKKLLNDACTLKLSANDILYTRRADGIINNLERTEAAWDSRLDTRLLTLSLSTRFGQNTSNRQRFNGSGSEEEQRRIRS